MTKCIYPRVLLYVRLTIKERLREGEQREGYPSRIRCICMTVCYHKGEREREPEDTEDTGRKTERERDREERDREPREGGREREVDVFPYL